VARGRGRIVHSVRGITYHCDISRIRSCAVFRGGGCWSCLDQIGCELRERKRGAPGIGRGWNPFAVAVKFTANAVRFTAVIQSM
jgi:hypothetical protein